MKIILYLGFLALGLLSFRRRWAYVTFVILGLLYFPAGVGFRVNPQPCSFALNSALAVHSLGNYQHIILFVLFFFMSVAQFGVDHWSGFCWAALAAITMGMLVEIAEGFAGNHDCRLRDLIPDSVGILIGATTVLLWLMVRKKLSPA